MKNWQEWAILLVIIVVGGVAAGYINMKLQEKQLEKLMADSTGETK